MNGAGTTDASTPAPVPASTAPGNGSEGEGKGKGKATGAGPSAGNEGRSEFFLSSGIGPSASRAGRARRHLGPKQTMVRRRPRATFPRRSYWPPRAAPAVARAGQAGASARPDSGADAVEGGSAGSWLEGRRVLSRLRRWVRDFRSRRQRHGGGKVRGDRRRGWQWRRRGPGCDPLLDPCPYRFALSGCSGMLDRAGRGLGCRGGGRDFRAGDFCHRRLFARRGGILPLLDDQGRDQDQEREQRRGSDPGLAAEPEPRARRPAGRL